MYGNSRHSSNRYNKEFRRYCMKIFKKIERSISKCMIFACHRLGKTMKTIVDFANRKDAELVLKSKKKLCQA